MILKDKAVHVVVDSTGVKVYGEGEWKVRTHGVGKRRIWRKLHLGVDEGSGEILAAVVTTNDVADCEVLPDLLEQIDRPVEQVSGDGGYDRRGGKGKGGRGKGIQAPVFKHGEEKKMYFEIRSTRNTASSSERP